MTPSFTGQLLRRGDAGFPDAAVSRIFNRRRPSTRPAAVLRAMDAPTWPPGCGWRRPRACGSPSARAGTAGPPGRSATTRS